MIIFFLKLLGFNGARAPLPAMGPVPASVAAGTTSEPQSQPRSSAVGVETVRSLSLMLMAACLASLVLMTQKLLRTWAGDDVFLGWTVLFCVMLAALVVLSRVSGGMAHRLLAGLDAWALRLARQRAAKRKGPHAG
jgi:hypothetical protein